MSISISDVFSRCQKKAALLAFITAGFPRIDSTDKMLHTMAAAGADILEVGVPFSDPMADGPAIQRSSEVALKNGMTLIRTLSAINDFRTQGGTAPVVLMGYANSFINFGDGLQDFAAAAGDAGVQGIIVVDTADEERQQWRKILNQGGLDLINLVAPTTAANRMSQLSSTSQGFVYAISLKGVTGAAHIDVAAVQSYISNIRHHTSIPVAAGFGIRTASHARAFADIADGIVIGSRLVEAIESAGETHAETAIGAAVGELSEALMAT